MRLTVTIKEEGTFLKHTRLSHTGAGIQGIAYRQRKDALSS